MSRFYFELEPLLRLRTQAEENAQRNVAVVLRERQAIEDRLRQQQHLIISGRDELRERLTGALDASALRDQAGSVLVQMREAQRVVLELAGVQRRLEAAQGGLRAATADRKAIEILRERRHEEWKRQRRKDEQSTIDDLVSARASRGDSAP